MSDLPIPYATPPVRTKGEYFLSFLTQDVDGVVHTGVWKWCLVLHLSTAPVGVRVRSVGGEYLQISYLIDASM